MAIVSAAIAAISLAITATSAITVASAAIAVGAVVGVAGLATSVIGAVTKNKDLMKAGKIMSYVGLAGGLAGGAIGGFGALASGGGFFEGAGQAFASYGEHVSNAWDQGIGSWFAADPGTSQAAAAMPDTSMNYAPGIEATTTPPHTGQVAATPGLDPDAGFSALGSTPTSTAQPAMTPLSAGTPAPPAPPVATDVAQTAYQGALAQANPGQLSTFGQSNLNYLTGTQPYQPLSFSVPQTTAKGLWEGLPDWAKTSLIASGVQGIGSIGGGVLSGHFAGLSAEQRLEFEKLINEQNQQQRALYNTRGGYSPLVTFGRNPKSGALYG